ncbi:MAG: PLP-dependent aminotransferase family protein [Chloroflexota bacterium]
MDINWSSRFANRTQYMQASAIRELLKVAARPDVISFAGGLPAAEVLPVEEVAVATENILRKQGRVALQYGASEGYAPLREQIAAMYRAHGVPATVDNILLTNGSQQGLDLIGRVLINEGDSLLVEAPTYVGALQAWRPLAPNFLTISIDDQGMCVDEIDSLDEFSLTYVLPNFQNPTGVTLAGSRRERLVRSIHARGALIVEDDPYHELRYSGQASPSLIEIEAQILGADWNKRGRVIYLGTFSKTLAPGLRVGWVLAPDPVITMMTLAKQGTDLHTSMLSQMIVSELIDGRTIEQNLPRLRSVYGTRRDAMVNALQAFMGDCATWTHPDGGLFLWLTLKGDIDTAVLLDQALEEKKIAYVPGNAFYLDGSGTHEMRLNFSCMSPARIHEGIERLASLIPQQSIVQ